MPPSNGSSDGTSFRRDEARRQCAPMLRATWIRKLRSAPGSMSAIRRVAVMNVRCSSSSMSESGTPARTSVYRTRRTLSSINERMRRSARTVIGQN